MSDEVLAAVLMVAIIMLLRCYTNKNKNINRNRRERFSLSNKPMEHDNSLLHRNPYDDIDYVTPTFVMLR
jgi:hypothetical protein